MSYVAKKRNRSRTTSTSTFYMILSLLEWYGKIFLFANPIGHTMIGTSVPDPCLVQNPIYIYICVCVCLCNHTFVCILGWHNQGPARVPRDPARGPRDLRAHGSVANPPEAWTKNAYTLPKNKQVHVVHQTMLPRILAKSFVGQSFANALCPPAFRKRRTWT